MRLFPLLFAVACISDVSIDLDGDADGLLDSDEVALGSDPGTPDSDEDGWLDGEEADQNTDPTDAADKPYQNGWPIDACRDDVEPTGTSEGEVSDGFELTNQFGEVVRLHDFCDQVVFMVFSAGWCGACQAEAATLESFYTDHKAQGLMVLEVYIEDEDSALPEQDDLVAWADTYGLSIPVVADPNGTNMYKYAAGMSSVGLPFSVLLDRGMEVVSTDYPGHEDVEALLTE